MRTLGEQYLPQFKHVLPPNKVKLLVHKAKPIEDHRFDGAADGDNAGLRACAAWLGPARHQCQVRQTSRPRDRDGPRPHYSTVGA